MRSLLARLLIFTAAGSLPAAEFHVAQTGNDANPGTAAKPFATIAKARDAARAVPGPNTILLAPGRYFNESGIVLDERDSGLTIKGAQPGAAAEVYGGMPVTGWEKWKGDIWRAPVPKGARFFNLIVDGKPATMAQTPNLGSGFGGGVGIGNTAITVPAAWRAYDYADAQVAGAVGNGCWFSEVREVLAATPTPAGALPIDPGGTTMFNGLNGGHSVVRGVLELLDEPGEWCLKHRDGFVYYWPALRSPAGEAGPHAGSPADHVIIRPTSEKLLEVRGRSPQAPARDIAIENLSLIGSDFCPSWRIFSDPGKINSMPAETRQGLVFGENVQGLKISGCRILAAGHCGVFLNQHAQACVVENCLITQAGVSAVCLHGWVMGEGPFQSAAESYVNKGHRIENNFIYDCGQFVAVAAAISMYQSGDTLIARNEIRKMARCGVMLNGVRWGVMPKTQYGKALTPEDYYEVNHLRNVRIVGNEVHNVCRDTDDFGAIEAWGAGRDGLWENNEVHDLDHAQRWDTWGHAIFPDDSDPWMTVRGNIVHHFFGGRATGAIMVKNIEQVVENNLVIDCKIGRLVTFSPYMEPAWNMTIRHNIFAMPGVDQQYGDMNDFCLTGKSFAGWNVPEGAKGIREVDYNWFVPKDPANPNPAAEKYKIDLHSTFGPAPVKRLKPDWDIAAADYQVDGPAWWKPIDTSNIGLRPDFPFDTLAATRRSVGEKIQAEDYQRRSDLRAVGGYGIAAIGPGAWAKYANIDFGSGGATRALFTLAAAPAGQNAPKPFIRRYGSEVVEEVPFKGDKSVETIFKWEISKPYTRAGKTGPELFDEVFPPETDIKAGEWSPYLGPLTSKLGVSTEPGVVDAFMAHGEEPRDACAYARASVWAQGGRQNATMTISCANGVKVWLNGQLIISEGKAGTYSETRKGVINVGWNTILIKAAQGTRPEDFSFTFGTVASGCGHIVSLPGLPTEERADLARAKSPIELRLDSPKDGKLIGALLPDQTECPIEKATGVHNLYLVFPGNAVKSVDWFQFMEGP
jgi:hypothetical protein